MAKVLGGLLGGFSGKIGGLVGGKWKDTQYARAYVVPSNPNTVNQQETRTRFKLCALMAMSVLGTILQPYMDTMVRGMSAFNWFVKTNIALFVDPINFALVSVTKGSLFPAAITNVDNTSEVMTVNFNTGLGSNGLASDLVYAVVYDNTIGRAIAASAEVLRSASVIQVTLPADYTADQTVFLVTCRRDLTDNVIKVSDSQAAAWTMV